MQPANTLAGRLCRQSSFFTLVVCLATLVPAGRAQHLGAPIQTGHFGGMHPPARAAAPAGPHHALPVATQRGPLPGPTGVASRSSAIPRQTATIPGSASRPVPAMRAHDADIVIPLQSSAVPRNAPRPALALPANGGSIVITWPAPPRPANRSTSPSSVAPRGGIVRASGTPLLQPLILPRRTGTRSAFALVSSGGVVFVGQFGTGPAFFGSPFFCDRFGFALFGFDPFFFPSAFCPFCPSSSLGLPLLSVNTFGFGPPFFLPFGPQAFFGRRFFGPRFFDAQFFSGFFPAFVTEAGPVESNPAEAEEEEDPAIIPSAIAGGPPSEAESMAAAPGHARPPNTLLLLQDGAVYTVADYWLGSDWRVHYVATDGKRNSVPLDRVDVFGSMRVNLARGGAFLLDDGPHAAAP